MIPRAEYDRREEAEEEDFVVEGDDLDGMAIIKGGVDSRVVKDEMDDATDDHSNTDGDGRLGDKVHTIDLMANMLDDETP